MEHLFLKCGVRFSISIFVIYFFLSFNYSSHTCRSFLVARVPSVWKRSRGTLFGKSSLVQALFDLVQALDALVWVEVLICQHLGHGARFLIWDWIGAAVSTKTILCHEQVSIFSHGVGHSHQIYV